MVVRPSLGSLRRAGHRGQTKSWEGAWEQKTLVLGLLECVLGRLQGSWRRCPGPKCQRPEQGDSRG